MTKVYFFLILSR